MMLCLITKIGSYMYNAQNGSPKYYLPH